MLLLIFRHDNIYVSIFPRQRSVCPHGWKTDRTHRRQQWHILIPQGRILDEAAADACMPKPRPSRLKHMPKMGSVLLVPSFRHTEDAPMIGHRWWNPHASGPSSVRRLRERSLCGCTSSRCDGSDDPIPWWCMVGRSAFSSPAGNTAPGLYFLLGFAGDVRFASHQQILLEVADTDDI